MLPAAPVASPRACLLASSLALAALLAQGCAMLQRRPSEWERAGQAPSIAAQNRPGEALTRNVVLVTIDGARWQEVFLGIDPERAADAGLGPGVSMTADQLLPNVYRHLVKDGVALGAPGHGAPVLASNGHSISLPGYIELLSGRPSASCSSNGCPRVSEPTLLDALRGELGASGDQVAVISSWNMIDRAASPDASWLTVSCGQRGGQTRDRVRVDQRASAALDEGASADHFPGEDDYRPDRFTAEIALRYLEQRRPRFLMIGLGDTDEYAHKNLYAGYLGSLRRFDDFVGQLFGALSSLGDYGAETTVVVTADHGRGYGKKWTSHGPGLPESARVFLLASGGSVPALGYVDLAQPARLADVAPSLRAMLGLPGDPRPGAGMALAALSPRPPASRWQHAGR